MKYCNLRGNSGIREYTVDSDYIVVVFSTGAQYRYSYASAGKEHVENMKKLAEKGTGLNSYIMRNVRLKYER